MALFPPPGRRTEQASRIGCVAAGGSDAGQALQGGGVARVGRPGAVMGGRGAVEVPGQFGDVPETDQGGRRPLRFPEPRSASPGRARGAPVPPRGLRAGGRGGPRRRPPADFRRPRDRVPPRGSPRRVARRGPPRRGGAPHGRRRPARTGSCWPGRPYVRCSTHPRTAPWPPPTGRLRCSAMPRWNWMAETPHWSPRARNAASARSPLAIASSMAPAVACSSIRTNSTSAEHHRRRPRGTPDRRRPASRTRSAGRRHRWPRPRAASSTWPPGTRHRVRRTAHRLSAAASAHPAAGWTMHAPGRAATDKACNARARAGRDPPRATSSMAATFAPPSGRVAKYQYQPSGATSHSPASGREPAWRCTRRERLPGRPVRRPGGAATALGRRLAAPPPPARRGR